MGDSCQIRLVESDNVSSLWKILHLICLICASLFGLTAGAVLSYLFLDESFLCGTPKITEDDYLIDMDNDTRRLQIVMAGPNADNPCAFTQYSMISSFIFGSIWITFFLMCGPGGKSESGLPQPWRIVLPALVFSTIYLFVTLGAGIQLSSSIGTFCAAFDKELEKFGNNSSGDDRCHEIDNYLNVTGLENFSIKAMMTVSEIHVWLCAGAWVACATICFIRVIVGPDFLPVATVCSCKSHAMEPGTSQNGNNYAKFTNSNSSLSSKAPEAMIRTSQVIVHHPPTDLVQSLEEAKQQEHNVHHPPTDLVQSLEEAKQQQDHNVHHPPTDLVHSLEEAKQQQGHKTSTNDESAPQMKFSGSSTSSSLLTKAQSIISVDSLNDEMELIQDPPSDFPSFENQNQPERGRLPTDQTYSEAESDTS